MSKTIDIQIEKSQNLIKGLRKHVSEKGNSDFNEKEIAKMETVLKQLQEASEEVTRLRDELAPKVKHMNAVFETVKVAYNERKKKLKGFYTQEQWADYGIPDKR